MELFVYNITPIDCYWEFLPTLENVRTILRDYDNTHALQSGEAVLPNFEKALQTARMLAKKVGWEEDVLGDIHVFWLPSDVEFEYGFVWKQPNNGSTFVVTPQELDHLKPLTGFPSADPLSSRDL